MKDILKIQQLRWSPFFQNGRCRKKSIMQIWIYNMSFDVTIVFHLCVLLFFLFFSLNNFKKQFNLWVRMIDVTAPFSWVCRVLFHFESNVFNDIDILRILSWSGHDVNLHSLPNCISRPYVSSCCLGKLKLCFCVLNKELHHQKTKILWKHNLPSSLQEETCTRYSILYKHIHCVIFMASWLFVRKRTLCQCRFTDKYYIFALCII